LFRAVSEVNVQKPTYKAFDNLSTYFKPDTSVPESFDSGRTQAINAFLDEVLKSRVMQATRSFLGKYGPNKLVCVQIMFNRFCSGGQQRYLQSVPQSNLVHGVLTWRTRFVVWF
jgi:hypothetical protein